jgi:hypothetical protein
MPPIPQPLSPDLGGKGSNAIQKAISLPPEIGGKGRG